MKPKFAGLVAGIVLCAGSAQAHHSFAMYDIDNKISRTGVVTKIQYSNPHIQFVVEVTNKDGKKEVWEIESMNTARWDRNVGNRNVAKVGETVTILGWPARDGSDRMALSAIDSPSAGKTLVVANIRQQRARENIPEVTIKRE